MQHPVEFAVLLAMYRLRNPQRVLEIGSFEGGTLFHWLRSSPELVVAVDDFWMANRQAMMKTWPKWARFGTRLEIIDGRSQDDPTFRAVERHAPFDWAFLDADHSYDAVKADWERYRPLCNGVIAFHDILPPSDDHPEIEVSRLWDEIKADGYETTELIDDPDASWGGIGVVFLDGKGRP